MTPPVFAGTYLVHVSQLHYLPTHFCLLLAKSSKRSMKPRTWRILLSKCTMVDRYIVHLRYSPPPGADVGSTVSYDQFQTGLSLKWWPSWTDKAQMLHIISTEPFEDPVILLSSSEGCSKPKFTRSSSPSPRPGPSLHFLLMTARLLLISSSLPARHTTHSEPSNISRANWHRLSIIVNPATSSRCLATLQPSIPSCTNPKFSYLVAGPPLGFR